MSTHEGSAPSGTQPGTIRLLLAGDVMLGRGIDQILPHPSPPRIYEPHVTDARDYVSLAEARSGRIERPVDYAYVWGDALVELERCRAHARIVNLETAITTSEHYWKGKGINYRMSPANLPCLGAASIDCCVLANNHVLDWGYDGLKETLLSLREAGVRVAGAGTDAQTAAAPAVLTLEPGGRVLVFAYAAATSGTPRAWAAGRHRPGINLLAGSEPEDVSRIADDIALARRPHDLLVISIHWGENWGYAISQYQRALAHALIEELGADVIHGHSSHHPIGIEIYRGKLVLYGCGDLLNDYEGIPGREGYRGDLTVLYLATLAAQTGRLVGLDLVPMRLRRLRLNRASEEDVAWLRARLDRECRKLGTSVQAGPAGRLVLRGTGLA